MVPVRYNSSFDQTLPVALAQQEEDNVDRTKFVSEFDLAVEALVPVDELKLAVPAAIANAGTQLGARKRGVVDVVLGAQWGDEGKGKLVDILSSKYSICARVAGGSNAGHTIVVDVSTQLRASVRNMLFFDPYLNRARSTSSTWCLLAF